jgi:hypothetical protein
MNVNELKIVVSKEVADIIEALKLKRWSVNTLIEDLTKAKLNGTELWPAFKEMDFRDIILAWEFGYTVEKSPEEQILELYNRYLDDVNSGDYDRMPGGESAVFAIEQMLRILKMEVPGIKYRP